MSTDSKKVSQPYDIETTTMQVVQVYPLVSPSQGGEGYNTGNNRR